jgi:GntR family transcriptional regulator
MVGQDPLVPDERQPQLPTDRVEAELRARVEAGEWEPGARLPSIPKLAKEHNTSRATMNRAVRRLADDGLLTVVPNWGTFRAES